MPSSLSYALVRDFAYPDYHQLHYGAPLDPPSGATTPGSEAWPGVRRLSDPATDVVGGTGGWSAGPWGGDGGLYGEPDGESLDALPATSFGVAGDPDEDDGNAGAAKANKHRKSKSYANMSDFERGRRRESGSSNFRRSRMSQASGASGDSDMFLFQGNQHWHPTSGHLGAGGQLDPAGAESLRHSRGYQSGNTRRDSHAVGQLPPRSFHTSQTVQTPLDSDMPLDTEIPVSPAAQQRESMGPEDELFAGESLALYSFEPENPNELRLQEGQIILVSYRHGQGWLVAEDPRTGEQGLVPEEYVRLLADMEGWDAETGTFQDTDEEAEGEESTAENSGKLVDGMDHEAAEDEPESTTDGTEEASPEVVQELIDDTDALEMVDSRKSTEARQDSAHAKR